VTLTRRDGRKPNSAWRNTCVEDWHAEGRIHDGDMMRINSHMTWRTRQILRRWMTDTGLAADGSLSALDGVPAEDVEWLAIRVFRWLVNPGRKLATGTTLASLAGDDLGEYEDAADLRLGGFAKQAADRGARFGLALAAAHGAAACPHWWGHPRWPDLVDRLMRALDDPAGAAQGQPGPRTAGSRKCQSQCETWTLVKREDVCVRRQGLEPRTRRLRVCCSNQLS
jgi:hypothetical protein